jgi:hypothetical protein
MDVLSRGFLSEPNKVKEAAARWNERVSMEPEISKASCELTVLPSELLV